MITLFNLIPACYKPAPIHKKQYEYAAVLLFQRRVRF